MLSTEEPSELQKFEIDFDSEPDVATIKNSSIIPSEDDELDLTNLRRTRHSAVPSDEAGSNEDKVSEIRIAEDDIYDGMHKESSDDNVEPLAKATKPAKAKKQKLKDLLVESEALLRDEMFIELPVKVSKPAPLSLIINEALALNSKNRDRSREAKQAAQDEHRNLHRRRLERLLGPERVSELLGGVLGKEFQPKIGAVGLDEALELEVPEGESNEQGSGKLLVQFKLTNLPDEKPSALSASSSRCSSKSVLNRMLGARPRPSIDSLNEQLQTRIQAQSQAQATHLKHQIHKQQRALTRQRQSEERQRQQKNHQVRQERALRAKREQTAAGPRFDKYSNVKRPERAPKILVSDDDEEESADFTATAASCSGVAADSDMYSEEDPLTGLNLSDYESDGNGNDDLDELPEMSAAIEVAIGAGSEDTGTSRTKAFPVQRSITDFLSGNFSKGSKDSEAGTLPVVAQSRPPLQPLKVELVKTKKRSEFLDDEADDEDEELEAELIDEAVLQQEMEASNFIHDADDGDPDADGADVRALHQKRLIEEDAAALREICARFGGGASGDDTRDAFMDSLTKRYLNHQPPPSRTEGKLGFGLKTEEALSFGDDDDVSLKALLDPRERSRKKLEVLGTSSILGRKSILEPSEFSFPEESTPKKMKMQPTSKALSEVYYYASSSERDSSAADDFSFSEDEDGIFEVESGLQSRLDAEEAAVDLEEVQVQADESLNAHLSALVNNGVKRDKARTTGNSAGSSTPTTATGRSAAQPLLVPRNGKHNEQLRAKLQHPEDEGKENSSGGTTKAFKGFRAVL